MENLSVSSQAQNWGAGVHVRNHLARQAVQLAYEKVDSEDVTFFNKNKLGIEHAYLQLPFPKIRSAKAHILVTDVQNFAKKCSAQCKVLSKNTALANRDALVLQMCCSVDSTNYVCFEFAMETAFNIKNIKVFKDTCGGLNDLDSQMHLSCNSIQTLVRDRSLFDRTMPKIFGPMPAEDLQTFFAAYVRCVAVTTFEKPNKARPRRKKKEKRTADGPPGVFCVLGNHSPIMRRCRTSTTSHRPYKLVRLRVIGNLSANSPCLRIGPRGGPRDEMTRTASQWLDSALANKD